MVGNGPKRNPGVLTIFCFLVWIVLHGYLLRYTFMFHALFCMSIIF